MGFELVTTYFPLVVGRLDGKPTEEEADAFRAGMDEILDQSQRFGQLLDLRSWSPETPEQRKRHSEWTNLNRERIGRLSVGAAFVVPSMLARVATANSRPLPESESPVTRDKARSCPVPEQCVWVQGSS